MIQRRLLNKLSLITGSTSGIGLGIAKALANEGSNVILNGFGNITEINDIKRQIESDYKVKCYYENADISNIVEIERMFQNINDHHSNNNGLDILVNNAGIQYVAKLEDYPVSKWDAVIATNLTSCFHTIRLALPSMQKKNFGRIINIASVHGLVGSAEKSAYVAAKHGVVGLTKVVALENATINVTCNAICPGWVLTNLVQNQIESRAKNSNISYEEAKDNLLSEKQPSKEFVTTSQLGDLAVFLSSDSGSQIRGVAWQMDGGWTAQ